MLFTLGILGILGLIGILSFLIFRNNHGEQFANQYSLLSRDEPQWLHFGITKKPRVSSAPDPTFVWWRDDFWKEYDKSLENAKEAEIKNPEINGFKPSCKLSLDASYGYESHCKDCFSQLYSNPRQFCKLNPDYRKCKFSL